MGNKKLHETKKTFPFSQFRGSNIMFQDGNAVQKAVGGMRASAH